MNIKLASVFAALAITTSALPHPGGGLVVLGPDTVLASDPLGNALWLVKKGEKARRVLPDFHTHWVTKGRDGAIYAEQFGVIHGALNKLDGLDGKSTVIAQEKDVQSPVFLVGRNGDLIFQRGQTLVSRAPTGEVSVLAKVKPGDPELGKVFGMAWGPRNEIAISDGSHIRWMGADHIIRLRGEIAGSKDVGPIWKQTPANVPYGISVDPLGRILAAVPELNLVVRIHQDGSQQIVLTGETGWRPTAVAAMGDSFFVMESSDRNNDGPRVRKIGPDGKAELIGVIGASLSPQPLSLKGERGFSAIRHRHPF